MTSARLVELYELMLAVTGQARLLDRMPVLQRSIDRRNPYVDPLSFIQVELLRRLRRDGGSEELTRAMLLTINGIAGGSGTLADPATGKTGVSGDAYGSAGCTSAASRVTI